MGSTVCRPYVIQPGDTLWSLGQRYGFSTRAMLDANPGVDPNNLQIGQRVNIPR